MTTQKQPAFEKYTDQLVPVVVQDHATQQVLMLGYVNAEAWHKTLTERVVTFYSRSKQRLWTKGETSGHTLELLSWHLDCDDDAILVQVKPNGPTCHTGSVSCFETDARPTGFLGELEEIIADRLSGSDENSYTRKLVSKGIHKVAQKVGEEGVEVVIEALRNDDDLFLGESADLLFHLLVLLQAKGKKLEDVEAVLRERHAARK